MFVTALGPSIDPKSLATAMRSSVYTDSVCTSPEVGLFPPDLGTCAYSRASCRKVCAGINCYRLVGLLVMTLSMAAVPSSGRTAALVGRARVGALALETSMRRPRVQALLPGAEIPLDGGRVTDGEIRV